MKNQARTVPRRHAEKSVDNFTKLHYYNSHILAFWYGVVCCGGGVHWSVCHWCGVAVAWCRGGVELVVVWCVDGVSQWTRTKFGIFEIHS